MYCFETLFEDEDEEEEDDDYWFKIWPMSG